MFPSTLAFVHSEPTDCCHTPDTRKRFTSSAGSGLLGTALTLSAAFDFQRAHAHVQNRASGALEQDATITYSEMMEHSFYQMLNIAHIVFLHGMCRVDNTLARAAAVVAVTTPWLLRHKFPVNSFSANYRKEPGGLEGSGAEARLIRGMYRTKKMQYLLYKHVLLHGLNISVAVSRCVRHGSVRHAGIYR